MLFSVISISIFKGVFAFLTRLRIYKRQYAKKCWSNFDGKHPYPNCLDEFISAKQS